MEELAGKICKDGRFESGIEKRKDLGGVCQYSVVSKACSAGKSAVRLFYLELLALKRGTTPIMPQSSSPDIVYYLCVVSHRL